MVTFGLTIVMGIAMGLVYSIHQVTSFVLLQMYYLAMGVIIALLLSRERRKDLPIKFFGTYLFFSVTSVLYLVLRIFRFTLTALILGGNPKDIFTPFLNPVILIRMLLLPLTFFIGIMPYIGEELGWRYFLLPIFQKNIGKRKGIIFLGLMWGIWHLPVNLFYHSPTMSFYNVLNQLVVCEGYRL